MRSRFMSGCLVAIAFMSFSAEAGGGSEKRDHGRRPAAASEVSIYQLIVTPERFEGATIGVEGVLRFDEGVFLCDSMESGRYGVFENCLVVELDYDTLGTRLDGLLRLHGKHGRLYGEFRGALKGMYGLAAGGLTAVTRLVENVVDYAPAEDRPAYRSSSKEEAPAEDQKTPSSQD